jgi:hypothetical protein
VGISSGVLKSSREIRDEVEFVPKGRAYLKQSFVEQNNPNFGGLNNSLFPKDDCVVSGTPQHVVDECPSYLHRVLRRSSVTQLRWHLDAVMEERWILLIA